MTLLYEIRKRGRHIVGPFLAISAFSYFAYHSVQGDRGLLAWVQLSQQVEIAQATLEKVSGERAGLEHRTRLLRPDNLDPDMLDERARQVLNLSRPDELIILDSGPAAADPMRGQDWHAPDRSQQGSGGQAPPAAGSHAALSILIPAALAAPQAAAAQ